MINNDNVDWPIDFCSVSFTLDLSLSLSLSLFFDLVSLPLSLFCFFSGLPTCYFLNPIVLSFCCSWFSLMVLLFFWKPPWLRICLSPWSCLLCLTRNSIDHSVDHGSFTDGYSPDRQEVKSHLNPPGSWSLWHPAISFDFDFFVISFIYFLDPIEIKK